MGPSGKILDDKRVRSHLETLRALEDCRVVLMAHQSRAGKKDFTTLEAHAKPASRLLREMSYIATIYSALTPARPSSRSSQAKSYLLENTRFFSQENLNRTPAEHAKSIMVKQLAPLFDLFVNYAFAVCHRSHLSVVGFTEVLPSIAGPLIDKEATALDKGLKGHDNRRSLHSAAPRLMIR